MFFWISLIELFLLIVIVLLFVFVLRKHIFSRKTGKVLTFITIGFIIVVCGIRLLTMPLITHKEASVIAKETISPYVEKKIYDSQIHADINNRNYLVSIDFRNKGYAEVRIDIRSGEVLYAIINNFNGEDIEIY